MDVETFDFELPGDLIAQHPAAERTGARLLHLPRDPRDPLVHGTVRDLVDLLRPGDLLVANDTRVFPARLLGHRVPSGGAVECLLVGRDSAHESVPTDQYWDALVHPGQKLKPGARVRFAAGEMTLECEILDRLFHGRRRIRIWTEDGRAVDDVVDAIGHIPLPPYIKRDDQPDDRERYQTVFASYRGSVAAPTAGLHLSGDLLAALAARQIEVVTVTLHVGYGTFQPVRVLRVEDHRVEAERYAVTPSAADAINRALEERRRVIAVGTTTTRVLEFVAREHGRVIAGQGSADLFIHPGYPFRVISGLLTNFHLPRSSLLMLVAAFGGVERVMSAYREAVSRGYRFYSYGDAMLIV
jgi:S-adenosylmethionine:tRNA ribosyltransferase-isomerase